MRFWLPQMRKAFVATTIGLTPAGIDEEETAVLGHSVAVKAAS